MNQDPFAGEELALLELVGASVLELAKKDSTHVIGHRWFKAAKDNINTSGKMQLFADTKKASECFQDKKMKKFVLDQFYEHPIEDWEVLAKWIGENTADETSGAYQAFHQLVECLSEKRDPSESSGANQAFHQFVEYFFGKREDVFEELKKDALLIEDDALFIEDIDVGALKHIENKKEIFLAYLQMSKNSCFQI